MIKARLREVKKFAQGHTATRRSAWDDTQRARAAESRFCYSPWAFSVNPVFSWKRSGAVTSPEPFSYVGAESELKSRPVWHFKNSLLKGARTDAIPYGAYKAEVPLKQDLVVSVPFGLAYSPLLTMLPPPPAPLPCIQPHKITPVCITLASTELQCWPSACKLFLSGWLLYLYWFKLFPLPIHYAGIPPCWGQLCYSFLWLKPKNYLSNSLGTNPLRVNILSQMGAFLSHCHLLNQEHSPLAPFGSYCSFFKEIEIGVEQESDVMPLYAESQRNALGITLVLVILLP